MDDLITFLYARLDEDEQTARTCITDSGLHLNGGDPLQLAVWRVTDRPATGTFVTTSDQWGRSAEIVPTYGGMYADYIARHDPARVLAEIGAKRKAIEMYERLDNIVSDDWTGLDAVEQILKAFGLAYADHPDYRDAWRP